MKSFEEIEKCWEENKSHEINANPLNTESADKVIRSRIRREKNIVMKYFWASFVYQILIYAFTSHLIIKFWGDGQIMLLSFLGAMLYIPFTIILMRKFKSMCMPSKYRLNSPGQHIQVHVKNQYTLLSEFFRFKKRFDWAGIPFSCFILVLILFKLYVKGGIEDHLVAGIISYLTVLSVFITATHFENRKRFISPLRQLELVLEDLKKP